MDLKNRFCENVAWPLNEMSSSMCVGITAPIKYIFKKDPHFFERIEERDVDKSRVASLFRKLFDQKYCQLLYLFITVKNSPSFKSGERYYCIRVTYKDCSIPFLMTWDLQDFRPKYGLVPLTVLKNNDKLQHDFSFEVE